jgi:hypothetical protein
MNTAGYRGDLSSGLARSKCQPIKPSAIAAARRRSRYPAIRPYSRYVFCFHKHKKSNDGIPSRDCSDWNKRSPNLRSRAFARSAVIRFSMPVVGPLGPASIFDEHALFFSLFPRGTEPSGRKAGAPSALQL